MMNLKEKIEILVKNNGNLISILSNASAILNEIDNINWCGFYLRENNYLYLGPFQGETACMKIDYGKGVCGTCFKEMKTIVVPNVLEFPGHIACSDKTRSEICVPIIKNDYFYGLIDIDSCDYNRFDEIIKKEIEEVASILKEIF